MGPKINTRDATDLKSVIKETIKELLDSEEFMNTLLQKVNEKMSQLEQKVNTQEDKINKMEQKIDSLQQNDKLRNICVYGMEEQENENLMENVIKLFSEKINVTEIKPEYIEKCYRVGNNKEKIRPVIIRFERKYHRNLIFKNCKNLKGTRITIAEDLTKNRLNLLHEIRTKIDRKKVHTYEGNIYVYINNRNHRIDNIVHFNEIFSS